jgi:hypothetical protein
MDNFFKKFVTQEELDELIKQALAAYDAAGEFQFLIANSSNDVVTLVKAAHPLVTLAPIAPAKPETALEKAETEAELTMLQVYGSDRVSNGPEDLPEPFRSMALAEQDEALEKLVGPAHAARKQAEHFIDKIVEDVLEKRDGATPMRESERPAIAIRTVAQLRQRIAAIAEEEDSTSTIARLMRCHADGDKDAMRRIIRQSLREVAA